MSSNCYVFVFPLLRYTRSKHGRYLRRKHINTWKRFACRWSVRRGVAASTTPGRTEGFTWATQGDETLTRHALPTPRPLEAETRVPCHQEGQRSYRGGKKKKGSPPTPPLSLLPTLCLRARRGGSARRRALAPNLPTDSLSIRKHIYQRLHLPHAAALGITRKSCSAGIIYRLLQHPARPGGGLARREGRGKGRCS